MKNSACRDCYLWYEAHGNEILTFKEDHCVNWCIERSIPKHIPKEQIKKYLREKYSEA